MDAMMPWKTQLYTQYIQNQDYVGVEVPRLCVPPNATVSVILPIGTVCTDYMQRINILYNNYMYFVSTPN